MRSLLPTQDYSFKREAAVSANTYKPTERVKGNKVTEKYVPNKRIRESLRKRH